MIKELEALKKAVEKASPQVRYMITPNIKRIEQALKMAEQKPRPFNPDHTFIEGQDFRPHSTEVKQEEVKKPAPKRRGRKKKDSDLLADNS